ncbi:MAG: hypothetical protein GXP30_10465 [Verrucomicrobia bacterium]|nr:hypothetical protein [Verrucomicrobiota bacterium]
MNKTSNIWAVAIISVLIVIGFFRVFGDHTYKAPENLDIVRNYREVDRALLNSDVILENGLIKKTYIVPPTIVGYSQSDTEADPFSELNPDPQELKRVQEILSEAGIDFGEGAWAVYNHDLNALTVVNTRDQLDMVEAYTESIGAREEQHMQVRVEIYELPATLAMEAIESAAPEGRHNAERDAILKAVGRGPVRLVNTITMMVRSGQRAKVEDVVEYYMEHSPNESAGEEQASGSDHPWDVRQVGTILEVDPIIGADGITIDLSLSLEHHTALPETTLVNGLPALAFHFKKTTTSFVLLSGSYTLLTSWRPTGKPEYLENDLMHVVFVTANIQTITGAVEMIEMKDSVEK